MDAWIPITIAAAFLQNARSALQKALKGRVGPTGATFVRFGFGLPFALIYAAAVVAAAGGAPAPNGLWAGYLTLGALTQIFATAALLASFAHDDFAVGTAYSKTEPLQAAAFGAVLLGETPSAAVVVAILLGVGGVGLLSWKNARPRLGPAVWFGLGAAALFGASAVAYRAAALSLDTGSAVLRAAVTLAAATSLQTILMAAWMIARAPGELRAVAIAWRPGALAGFAGAAASAGWFTAMALEPAAHVRALAQIEMLFTLAVSALIFRERLTARDLLGVALLVGGVLLLLRATA